MITQYYPYQVLLSKTHYIFESVGEKGRVLKVVGFTPTGENLWNLGFGVLRSDGFVDGLVITNNQDIHQVIRTVAKIAIDFLIEYPNSILEIVPADEKRKRLYNNIFQKYSKDIDALLDVLSTFEGKEEVYSPLKNYDSFKITLKS